MAQTRKIENFSARNRMHQAPLLMQLVLMFLFFPLTLKAQTTNPPEFVVPEIERIRARDELQRHVGGLIEKALKIGDIKDKREAIVNLTLSVDKARLNQEYQRHQQQQRAQEEQQAQQRWQESTSRFLEFLKAARELQKDDQAKQASPQATQAQTPVQILPRFGILNTSGSAPVATSPTNTTTPQGSNSNISPNINFSAPMSSFQNTPFAYSILEYLSDLNVEIHLPAEFKSEFRTELRKGIVALLNLRVLTNQNAEQKVKFVDLPALPADSQSDSKTENRAEQPSWFKDVVNPKNQSLSGLLMSIAALIGFLLVGLTVLLSGRKLAEAVVGLAQATQSKAQSSESEQNAGAGESVSAVEALLQPTASSSKSKFSADKEADLLSQTRNQISENVAQWCQKDPVTVGEVLVDLANGKSGMTTLNSLLLYLGYDNLKPTLELLPNKLLRKLDESLNDSWKEGAELLPGLEAAQLLLAGMIPRQTALLRFPFETGPLRKLLLKLDSQVLRELAQELPTDDFCVVFRILPQGLALVLSTQLPSEKLKEVMEGLDRADASKPPSESLLKIIESRGSATIENKGADKERLIRGMLKAAHQNNEARILDFIGPDDLLLRFELLQERFFLRDLAFVDPPIIRSLIDKMSQTRKANFLYFAEPSLRQSILDLYPKDSKTLETLLEELENIDKSPKRKTSAGNDRAETFSVVSAKLLEMVKYDPALRLSMIEKIATSMNAALPREIIQLADEIKETAA